MKQPAPSRPYRFKHPLALAVLAALPLAAAQARTAITTYHGDNQRTGWNASETALTPATVAASLHLVAQVPLDAQVDAQPLVVPGAAHQPDTVYVVTAADSVYAINAATGAIQHQVSLGTPVPESALPGACDNNDQTVGITSTPVIDQQAGVLYLIAYTYENNQPVYRLHALSLATLADATPPTIITATAPLLNGQAYTFDPVSSRQRAALLEANGNIYASFASFCDVAANVSHGWLLGWNANTLAPLAGNALINRQYQSKHNFFLTSIWMSGYGVAADPAGSLYFATSNADPSGASYDPSSDLSESVVKMSPDLTTVQSYFTPTAPDYGHVFDDRTDGDLGAGGVLVLPTQKGPVPNLAFAAGKTGPMFLLNRDALGGQTNRTVQSVTNDGCWCGASYFVGADGAPRIVASSGKQVTVYALKTKPKVTMTQESQSASLNTGGDGLFTSISSKGTTAGSAVIWAVTRPVYGGTDNVSLVAYDAAPGLTQLFSGVAGTWPNLDSNANLVPTVVNGQVYVASYRQLAIFGLGAGKAIAFVAPATPPRPKLIGATHEYYGRTIAVHGTLVTLALRNGTTLQVETAQAQHNNLAVTPVLGKALHVRGNFQNTTFIATTALRAKQSPARWDTDR